jgi:hypothetical protein
MRREAKDQHVVVELVSRRGPEAEQLPDRKPADLLQF